jgi:phosphonate transport system substrate-binding protein
LLVAFAPEVAAADPEPHRFAVVSFYNPRLMFLKYQPLVDYLSQRTGHPWQLEISRDYQEAVDKLCSGRVAAAYLGPFTYIRARATCGAEPVVLLQTGGEDTYRSVILVRNDAPLRRVADLKGKRFGFGSPLSMSSHVVPRGMLRDAGVEGDDVVCRYFGHHERAARAVLLGEVDACGVRDTVAAKFADRGLRMLATSPPIPNFPIVVGPRTPTAVRDQLVTALLDFPAAPPVGGGEWDEELAGGFAPVTDEAYDPVRELARRIFGASSIRLPEEALRCGGGEEP